MGSDLNSFNKADIYRAFFDSIMHDEIESVIHVAYNLLGFPIVCNDPTGITMMQYPLVKRDDPDWNYSLEHQIIQIEFFQILNDKYISDPSQYNKPLFVKEGYLSSVNQIIIILAHKRKVMAMVAIITEDNFVSDEALEIINVFIAAIRSVLKRLQTRQSISGKHLEAVLSETDHSSDNYLLSMRALERICQGHYQLIYIIRKSHSIPAALDDITMRFPDIYHNSICAKTDQTLTILLHSLSKESDYLSGILDYLDQQSIWISLSTTFNSIDQLTDYYFQARMTMAVGRKMKPEQTVFFHEQFVPFQIYAAASVIGDLNVFIHPIVREMNLYDSKYGTNYLHTLDAYIQTQKNKTLCTKKLFIHLNTLTYRLNKIEELFKIDLNDFSNIENIFSSILLQRYLNEQ